MENNAEKIFTDLKEDISTFTGLKFRLLKLMAIEKAAGVLSVFSHSLILLLFCLFYDFVFIYSLRLLSRGFTGKYCLGVSNYRRNIFGSDCSLHLGKRRDQNAIHEYLYQCYADQ